MPRTRYFFFGTLMDRDILELVLDRQVPSSALLTARLDGFRRVRVFKDSFPMLIEDRPGSVDGKVFMSDTPLDDQRIAFFEDYDYALEPCRPVTASGPVDALFCGADAVTQASDEPWMLEDWAARYKPAFLELSAAYMACFGKMSPVDAEPVWEEGRQRLVAAGLL